MMLFVALPDTVQHAALDAIHKEDAVSLLSYV